MPNRQRNTRANSACTPVRPSVIEVTYKAVGNKINSVEASAKPPPQIGTGMTPWEARTGLERAANSGKARSPRIQREAVGPANLGNPLIRRLHVEKERDNAEATRCLSTT